MAPDKTKSLVEFTRVKSGALSLVDSVQAVDGSLQHVQGKDPVQFTFYYMGFLFAVHAVERGAKCVLRVHGIIGHLPFSYHSAFARKNIWAVVKEASRLINGKVRVDEKQRILLIDTVIIDGILTPKVIITECSKVMLRLKPYLELIYQLQPPHWIDRDQD